jgi:scavenger receptor class B, member 1
VSLGMYKQEIFVRKTVGELLFEGYEDDLVKLSTIFDNDTPFDRIGLLVKKNATDVLSGTYTVKTGIENIFDIGKIHQYNNLTEFPYYEGECKKLKGSPGEFFSPEVSTKDPLYLFTPDMCRSLPYDYEKDIELHSLTGHRFSIGNRALDNGTFDATSKCFVTNEVMPLGVMNVSICNFGHPVFTSLPHFYGADRFYLDAIEGLSPDKEKHETYFTLEPVMISNLIDE